MDSTAQLDADLALLMTFHAAKCRLAVMIDARKRRGEATDDLEVELAFNRLEARTFATFLRAHPGPHT